MVTSATPPGPRATYTARLAARRATAADAARRVERIGNLRLGVFAIFLVALGAVGIWDVTAHLLWLPLLAFGLLIVRHGRHAAVERRARAAQRLYEDGLARLDMAWAGHGTHGRDHAPTDHPYAADLDLFGAGGVFELLCTTRTRVGEARLARWLLEPAPPDEIRARQAAARELAPRLDDRESFALARAHVRSALGRTSALAWARAPACLQTRRRLYVHRFFALTSTALLIAWLGFDVRPLWMVLSMLGQYVAAARDRAAVHEVLEAADRPAQDLALIGGILEHLEQAAFESDALQEMQGRLRASGDRRPSERIRGLVFLMDLVDARRNQIFLPLSWLGSLGTQWAYALEAWRAAEGEALETWLDVVARFEALDSLAGYTYEHPEDGFPEIVLEPTFEARGLGHPLLPPEKNVRNDVHLAAAPSAPQALLISGSNMSGKSTLLRSVGVAAAMAFAGAPVRAHALRISPLAIGASIQVHDSLQEGASRFYAEIERLSRIVSLSREHPPALFLLDEILHGTNSHDRRVGAAAVVRTLLARGALGLVTTHDLALATIAQDGEAAPSLIVNAHFEDQCVEDAEGGVRIAFDYMLRPGVVTRGNALTLMRLVGLDVESEPTNGEARADT